MALLETSGIFVETSSMLIEELNPDGTGEAIELLASTLPDRGVATEITQRVVRTWPLGATAPVLQVLGSELSVLRFGGSFDDGAMAVTNGARDLVVRLHRIANNGFPVRVTWSDLWAIEGIVARFRPTWNLGSQVTWELEIEPSSSTLTTQNDIKTQKQRQQSRADAEKASQAVGIVAASLWATQRSVSRAKVMASLAFTAAA